MEYFFRNFANEDLVIQNIQDQTNTMRPVYTCFCNPTAENGKHYDQPRFFFAECPCADCEQIALSMNYDISVPVFQVALTEPAIQYIFDSTNEKELHATIPQEMITAFTECATVYGSTDMSWSRIVDTFDDLHPRNKFSASRLENYFLQLAFLITFPPSDDDQSTLGD